MGVLLLPSKKKKITLNPVVSALNIVYTPSAGIDGESLLLKDPSGVGLKFQSVSEFAAEETITR